MMNENWIHLLRRLSQQKRLFAWLTFVILVASTIVDVTSPLSQIALLVFLFALLVTILDTHKHVSAKFKGSYPSLYEAWPDIQTEVLRGIQIRKSQVCWLGITLGDAWPQLNQILRPLAKHGKLQAIRIRLSQVDPEYLRQVIPAEPGLTTRAQASWAHIKSFETDLQSELTSGGSSIKVERYAYMPTFHGLLINDSVLFLSHVRWEGGRILVAEEPYERYDISSERGRFKIKLFRSWFEKSMTFRDGEQRPASDSGKLIANAGDTTHEA